MNTFSITKTHCELINLQIGVFGEAAVLAHVISERKVTIGRPALRQESRVAKANELATGECLEALDRLHFALYNCGKSQ